MFRESFEDLNTAFRACLERAKEATSDSYGSFGGIGVKNDINQLEHR